jgi:hypothetical protein
MRLGQIARKLDITPAELSTYLQEQFGAQDWGTNSRLTEAQLTQTLRHFAPHQADSFFQSEKLEEAPAVPEVAPVSTPVPQAEVQSDLAAESRPESVEVIKAPKVELSGLKVLGKIELPEKKKKEPTADAAGKAPEGEGSRPRRKPYPREERPQPRKNPIALQREREEREALRKKQEEAQRLKEKKAQRYFKAVQDKASKVTKAPRLVQEELEVVQPEVTKPAPKTWFGRFLRWLNT